LLLACHENEEGGDEIQGLGLGLWSYEDGGENEKRGEMNEGFGLYTKRGNE
jgi:hypothetical protein